MTIAWTAKALRQLRSQLKYIARDRPSAALRMDAIVDDTVMLLSKFPEMGKPLGQSGLRELPIARTPFIAIYRVTEDEVAILRFLHGAQRR